MKILRGISSDAPGGEHVLRVVPALGPYAQPAPGQPPLRQRLNFFPQRSLTHVALTQEQRHRAGDLQRLGQSVAPGVIDGLEVALENTAAGPVLVVMPGRAIAPDGQDLTLAYPLRVPAGEIPVISPRVQQALQERAGSEASWGQMSELQRQATLKVVLKELDGGKFLPHAMVLVARPLTVALQLDTGTDCGADFSRPCANALDDPAYARVAWEDGFQLAWVPWPADHALPPWSADGGATVDRRFRNRLAYAIFNAERERLSIRPPRSMRQWLERASLSPEVLAALTEQAADEARRAAPWPWETLGVPLSVVGFDAEFQPAFADRGAVVRQGGGRHNRSALVPLSGDDVLWQARVSQLLEHLAELPVEQRQAEALARQFDWLPPAGVLPLEVADFERGRQTLFPPSYDVQAQPVPLDMVDALIAESSALLPFNLSLRDQVQLLVPVPARYYDPDLLKLDERVHPLFDLEIARLERERQLLLSRRDGLRRRYDTLLRSVTGELPGYTPDDPNALPDETGALDALAFTRIHKSSVAPGQGDLHQFTAAHATLQFHATDELVFFVRIDQPVAGIGVRPLISTPGAPGTAPIVWGSMGGVAGRFNRAGDLPPTGQWARLRVPISRTALGGQKIDGFAFATFGGRSAGEVSWGHVGKVSDGLEFYWITDALPPGAVADGTWTWVTQGAGFSAEEDAAAGLPIEPAPAANPAPPGTHPHTRHVSELERLVASWKNYKGGVLMAELGEPINRPADAQTPPRPEEAGLDELIARLDARIRTAGDHIDFGFLRARTDIFRMRQTVLGTDEASRLLTSPAGSELIDRSNDAVASEKAFADYFGKLNEKVKAPPIFKPPAPAPGPGGVPRLAPAVRSEAGAAGLNLRLNNALFRAPSGFTGIAAPAETVTTTEVRAAVGGVSGARLVDARVELKTARISLDNVRARPLSTEPPPAVKDVIGSSLLGATYNSVTVAERFTAPPSVLSSNAAAKGKGDFVKTGIDLLQATGLVIDDLPVFGYQVKGAPPEEARKVTAGDLIKRGQEIDDLDAQEPAEDLHEAVYFRRGIDAVDNMIRFLRGVELRAEDYRRLQADAKASRERMLAVASRLLAQINAQAESLAVVRHDLSLTRALRAEEEQRLARLVARRKAILREQVPYLVFRRPRFTLTLQDVPLLGAQPALIDDPVPRCRREDHDAPPELVQMVDTLKDVPVRWLPRLYERFAEFDRVTDLQGLVRQAQQRLAFGERAGIELIEGGESLTGRLLARSFERQGRRLQQLDQQAARELARLDASSWKQAIEPVRGIVNARDILVAGPASHPVTLAAAGLLDDITGVATCLHNAFSQVPPATRLRWAELFSQLDDASSLRQLTVLPGFGDVRLGLDGIAWRQMQRMVDWLFGNVSADDDAQDAINDLVRVCLLLASHAPVKRIVGARIKRPVPAVIDTRIDLEIDPRTTRIGMQVLMHATAPQSGAAVVVARAVIEDIGAHGANARITQVMGTAVTTLDSSTRVQVQTGPALSTPAVQKAERQQVQAQASPKGSASAVPRPAAPQAPQDTAAAEKRIARQVETLRNSGRTARMR